MHIRRAFILLSLVSSAAWPADKPVIGPAPSWVQPIGTPPPNAHKADDAPVQVILADQQVALEQGRQTVFSEFRMRIGTPEGLAAGNISIPWRPETDVLTVHKLLIRRNGEVTDVLKSGQQFTAARREPNM
jgi:hypothetical protein